MFNIKPYIVINQLTRLQGIVPFCRHYNTKASTRYDFSKAIDQRSGRAFPLKFKVTEINPTTCPSQRNISRSISSGALESNNNSAINSNETTPIIESNHCSNSNRPIIKEFVEEYRSLTWYFIPPMNYEFIDESFLEKITDDSLEKGPFTFNVVTDAGEFKSGLDLIQCLVESPFHKDLDPQFKELKSQVENLSERESLNIHFRYNVEPQTITYEAPSILNYSTSIKPVVRKAICRIPMSGLFSTNSIEFSTTSGYEKLGYLSHPGDYIFVIVKSFNSALQLLDILKKHFDLLTLKSRVRVLVDGEDPTLALAVGHLFCSQSSGKILVTGLSISLGLESHQLLKKSASNVTPYHTGWIGSGMSTLQAELKKRFSAKEIMLTRKRRNANALQHFLRFAEENIRIRLAHSNSLLKASDEKLKNLACLEAEIKHGFKDVLSTLSSDTENIISRLSPGRTPHLRFPKYVRDVHLLLPGVPYYETELNLVAYQGFSRGLLKTFWDKSSKDLVELSSERPTITLPILDLTQPLFQKDICLLREALDTSALVAALSEYQDELYLRLSISIFGGALTSYVLVSFLPDSYILCSLPFLVCGTIYAFVKPYLTWCKRRNELELQIKGLDKKFASVLCSTLQTQIDAVRSPLEDIIKNNVLPYHNQLSARLEAHLATLNSLKENRSSDGVTRS